MNIILLGATGLVGSEFLQQVLTENPSKLLAEDDVNRVLYVGRKPAVVSASKSAAEFSFVSADLQDESELERVFSAQSFTAHCAPDILVCCLGTTIKQAGSKAGFVHVDYDLVMNAARAAKKIGVERMMIISAVNANAQSSIFYTQIKGRVEESLQALKFKQLILIKPSLLVGQRKQFRLAERISEPLMELIKPLLQGRVKKYRAVAGRDVAACMIAQLKNSKRGTLRVFPTDY